MGEETFKSGQRLLRAHVGCKTAAVSVAGEGMWVCESRDRCCLTVGGMTYQAKDCWSTNTCLTQTFVVVFQFLDR